MKKSELKKYIQEALTPDEATKVDSKYKDIYSGMLRDNPLKLKKYDNPDAVAYGRAIKLVQKESKLKEVYSEKQRKWACAQDEPKFDEMCKDTAISKKKTMENTRLQELIKSALKGPVTEETINEADYYNILKDISTQMSELESKDHKPFLEAIKKFVENKLKTLNEDKDWIQKAIKRPGALHRALDIPQDEDIPKPLINKDIKKMDKKEDEEGKLDPKDLRFLRQLDLAKTLEKFNENKLTERVLKELRGNINENILSKLGTKIINKTKNLDIFDKLADKIVSKMSKEDIANFKSKFNLNEDKSVPSVEDIFDKVHSVNPDNNVNEISKIEDEDSIAFKVANLVRNLTGINLLALGGAPLGAGIAILMGLMPGGILISTLVSLIASTIIHNISRKLVGKTDNDALVGD